MASGGAQNALFILGMDSRGVVVGARQATDAVNGMVRGTQVAADQIGRAGRGLFNQTAQWSFALQDVATVMFMGGGIERALLSASNNIAYLASASGTVKGALVGVGVVLASVIVPRTVDWLRNQQAITREAQKWAMIAQGIERSAQRAGRRVQFIQELEGAETAEDVEKMIRDNKNRAEQLQAEMDDRARSIRELRQEIEGAVTGVWPLEGGRFPGQEAQGVGGSFWEGLFNALSFDMLETGGERFEREAQAQLEQAMQAQKDAELEMSTLMDQRRMAQEFLVLQQWDLVGGLEEQVDLLKEVRRLSDMRPELAREGTMAGTQALLDAHRAAFDQRIIEQAQQVDPQQDELVRVLRDLDGGIDDLNAALNRGAALVPVN